MRLQSDVILRYPERVFIKLPFIHFMPFQQKHDSPTSGCLRTSFLDHQQSPSGTQKLAHLSSPSRRQKTWKTYDESSVEKCGATGSHPSSSVDVEPLNSDPWSLLQDFSEDIPCGLFRGHLDHYLLCSTPLRQDLKFRVKGSTGFMSRTV